MAERKVKGTMIIDYVRMIRGNKHLKWDQYLTPDDWKMVMQRILPSAWYPLEFYRKVGWATFKLIGKENPELARLRGRIRGKELFQETYKYLPKDQGPAKALERFVSMYSSLFNFSSLQFKKIDDKHVKIRHDYDPNDPTNVPYCYNFMGHLDSLVEMAGGQNGKITLLSKQWEGAPATVFDITWE